jgi:endonuclease YncB( thermonuclease family)
MLHDMRISTPFRSHNPLTGLLLAAPAFALPQGFRAAVIVGRVLGVADGHTITVLDATMEQQNIGIAGIDVLEHQSPFDPRTTQKLARCVGSRDLRLDWPKIACYGRKVRKV